MSFDRWLYKYHYTYENSEFNCYKYYSNTYLYICMLAFPLLTLIYGTHAAFKMYEDVYNKSYKTKINFIEKVDRQPALYP